MSLDLKFWPDPSDPAALQVRLNDFEEDLVWKFQNGPYANLVIGVEAQEVADLGNGRVRLEIAVEVQDSGVPTHGVFANQQVTMTRRSLARGSLPVPQFPSTEDADEWMAVIVSGG